MLNVSLSPVDVNQKQTFDNLYNLYLHDLETYLPNTHVDDTGFYDREVTNELFEHVHNGVNLFFIRADGGIAGLLVHSSKPLAKEGCDYHIHEIFVLNEFKGKGVSLLACEILFAEYKGKYALSVLENNDRAMAFWDKIIPQVGTLVAKELKEDMITFTFET